MVLCYATDYIPNFHEKMKSNLKYLNHKVNQWYNDLIEVLLLYEQDMFCDRMRKEVISSPSQVSEKQKVKADTHQLLRLQIAVYCRLTISLYITYIYDTFWDYQ